MYAYVHDTYQKNVAITYKYTMYSYIYVYI